MSVTEIIYAIPRLCRADKVLISGWLSDSANKSNRSYTALLPILLISSSLYGLALGSWHGWEMAFYVGIKFPIGILLTLCFTALLNGILAIITGAGFSFRQTVKFQLIGFTIFSVIMASVSPLIAFLCFNAPAPMTEHMAQSYRVFLTINVLLIATAGIISQKMLFHDLLYYAKSRSAGTRTFIQWLLVNLFVGSEVMHTLRPFFGAPKLQVEFLRADMFDRNFFESVYHVIRFLF